MKGTRVLPTSDSVLRVELTAYTSQYKKDSSYIGLLFLLHRLHSECTHKGQFKLSSTTRLPDKLPCFFDLKYSSNIVLYVCQFPGFLRVHVKHVKRKRNEAADFITLDDTIFLTTSLLRNKPDATMSKQNPSRRFLLLTR